MIKKDNVWLKEKIREAMIRAKTERQHGETMEEALVRELAAQGLAITEVGRGAVEAPDDE